MARCSFVQNRTDGLGGGIAAETSAAPRLTHCRFDGNVAAEGGGMFNGAGTAPVLAGCAFVGNAAIGFLTPLGPVGGAIYNSAANVTLTQCTLTANRADVGGAIRGVNGSLAVTNSIIWGNLGSAGPMSLTGVATGVTHSDVQGGFAGVGNVNADPRFLRAAGPGADGTAGTADDDGGDLRLATGSPAINAGNNAGVPAGLTTDLAGGPRVVGGTVDMGAHEGVGVAPAVLYVDARAGAGAHGGLNWANAFVSLQTALAAAVPGQTIRVAGGTYSPVAAGSTDRTVSFRLKNAVSLFGRYAGLGALDPDARNGLATILSGDIPGSDRTYNVVYVPPGVTAATVFDGFVVQNGRANGSTFRTINGGGMFIENASPTVSNCAFRMSLAAEAGGGVYVTGGAARFSRCDFTVNDARFGAAVYCTNSQGASAPGLTDCTFRFNEAEAVDSLGGAVYFEHTTASLTRCHFTDNIATLYGGAVFNDTSRPTITDCSFTDNTAARGGGIFSIRANAYPITRCTFTGNTAKNFGGGMANDQFSVPDLTDCTFTGNTAGEAGGGMWNQAESSPTLRRCTFDRNRADGTLPGTLWYGGAMFNGPATAPTLIDCVLTRNYAGFVGGGIYSQSASPALVRSTFTGNYCGGSGGGAADYRDSTATITDCVFVGNSGAQAGAVFINGAPGFLTNCTFVDNTGDLAGALRVGASTTRVTNCILWGRTVVSAPQIFAAAGATLIVAHSDVTGGFAGAGNIDLDPRFYRDPDPGLDAFWQTDDDDYGNLRLRADSPCVDAGDDGAILPSGAAVLTDVAGDPRAVDVPGVRDPAPVVDLGAYERQVAFTAAAAAYLYDAPRPSLKIAFAGDVSAATLAAGDLALFNRTTGQTVNVPAAALVSYDPVARAATWAFPTPLPDGNYRATVAPGSVVNLYGQGLSASYAFEFFVLAGDVNRDRAVGFVDLVALAQNYGAADTTFTRGDFNYDGRTDFEDLVVLAQRYNSTLPPAPSPAVVKGAAESAGERSRFSVTPVRHPAAAARPERPRPAGR
jgi:hypothetical protein